METWHRSEILYDGAIVRLRVGEAELDDGRLARREVVEHPGGVAVAAVHEGCVYLVRQHRIAVGAPVLELPAGKLEGGEDPAVRAAEELEEEVGLRAGRLIPVGAAYCSPGFTDELDHIFIALDCTPVACRPEADEVLEIVPMPLEEAEAALDRGEFNDMKTAWALRELFARYGAL